MIFIQILEFVMAVYWTTAFILFIDGWKPSKSLIAGAFLLTGWFFLMQAINQFN